MVTQPCEQNQADLEWHLGCNRGRAALFSAVIPGCGQLCSGKTVAAIIWFPAVVFAYLALPYLGLAAHGFCVFDAIERSCHGLFEDLRDVKISKLGTCVFGVIVLV